MKWSPGLATILLASNYLGRNVNTKHNNYYWEESSSREQCGSKGARSVWLDRRLWNAPTQCVDCCVCTGRSLIRKSALSVGEIKSSNMGESHLEGVRPF